MRDGLRIIDCDRHVMEPADMWERCSSLTGRRDGSEDNSRGHLLLRSG